MKRFTILLTLVGFLALVAVLQVWSEARAEAAKSASFSPVYDARGAMLEAINPKAEKASFSPVYDSTGAMLEALSLKEAEVQSDAPIVYDATGAMLDAINP